MAKKKKTTKKVQKKKTQKKKAQTKRASPKAKAKPSKKSPKVDKISIGELLPEFRIHATGGKIISSRDLLGKRIVLYFYPKDSTPGCTLEGHAFTRLHPQFQASNTEVFGISRDDLKSHEKFKSKEGFCFELLSDETGELSELFGVWKEKSMYGRTYMGIERSTFIIDEKGVLRKEWRAVKVDGHAEEVLTSIKSMS